MRLQFKGLFIGACEMQIFYRISKYKHKAREMGNMSCRKKWKMKEKWMNDEGKDIDGEKQRGSVNVTVFRVSQNCLRP